MRIFLVLLFAYVLSQFFRAFLAIVAGDLSRDLGLDAAQLGALSAIWFATFAISQFPVGYALDRFGPRRTIAGFMIVAVVGAGMMSAATGYYAALAAMAAIGVGCSPILMGSLYLFARNYPPERFAMMSSFIIGFGSLGNLLGATPLALAVEAFGWRESMAGIAAITAASALVCYLFLRDPPRVEQSGSGSGALAGIVEIAKLPGLWLIMPITFVSYAVVIATRGLWIAPYFSEVHGFTTTQTGNAALIMAAAMSIGALAYGPIERMLGDPKRTVALGSLVTVLCYVAVAFVGEGGALLAVILIGAVGGFGLTYAIILAHGRLFFPTRLIGRGVTFLNFASIGGAGVAQWLSGLFVKAQLDAGVDPATTYATLFSIFAGALALTLLIYLAAPSRPKV